MRSLSSHGKGQILFSGRGSEAVQCNVQGECDPASSQITRDFWFTFRNYCIVVCIRHSRTQLFFAEPRRSQLHTHPPFLSKQVKTALRLFCDNNDDDVTGVFGEEGEQKQLEIISTLPRRIGIPPPTVAPWREALYKDRQSNRRVGVF